MNIFVLDEDPVLAAQMHCNKHVVKMILETAQLMSTAIWDAGNDDIKKTVSKEKREAWIRDHYSKIYKPTHRKHPCALWARENSVRFNWLKRLGLALCQEYTYRYGKVHKSQAVIEALKFPIFDACFIDPPLRPFVQAMPDDFKVEKDAVQAYRNYYRGAKQRMLVYTRREPPEWIKDIATYKPL